MISRLRTLPEERLNTISHAVGLLFALLATPALIYFFQSSGKLLYGVAIYSFSMISVYLASTFYHGTTHPKRKRVFHKLDHIAIYFMIAGSYTPFVIIALDGSNMVNFMILIWSFVLLGSLYKVFFFEKYEKLSLLIYVLMGWLVIFQIGSFYQNLSIQTILLIFLGGLAYSIGIYFFRHDHKRYYHSIWHLFVLIGSIIHCLAVFSLN